METMESTPSATAPVVLDIGGEFGAAVLTAAPDLTGREVEFRAEGTVWGGRHVALHRRVTADGQVTAAVFSGLSAGIWQMRLIGGPSGAVTRVAVEGGRVTSAALAHTSS